MRRREDRAKETEEIDRRRKPCKRTVWEKRVEETTGRVKKRTEDRESQGDKGEEKEVRDRGRHKVERQRETRSGKETEAKTQMRGAEGANEAREWGREIYGEVQDGEETEGGDVGKTEGKRLRGQVKEENEGENCGKAEGKRLRG
jgi:hypothetical protein